MSEGTVGEDLELLRRAQTGDVAAYEALVTAYRDRVYGLALRMTRSEADAVEIVQDVFISAWKHLKDLRGDVVFGAWLHRIAANASLMRLRHRKVVAQVEQEPVGPLFNERGSLVEEVADFSRDEEGQLLDAELGKAISQATETLAEDYRRVFLLKDVEGLSYEEISEITGDSVPAIKSRLHRARLTLRAAIDEFYRDVE